ncbi:MAG TPA: alpha/beta hydrolase [Micromonosporaceae bacterium]|nr:alpha/beta hydrolase [Micromonosporaceae bacterium]HCU52261.1 alpha/beta hydrolase [Micromonosporaceae bacterium]
MELVVEADGQRLPATLTMPLGTVRAGLIPLHGAAAGSRDFYLYEHLARVLPGDGIAVLRFDRRPGEDGRDVPFHTQAADARAAIEVLRQHAGEVPVGLWGISQGGWAAPVTAAAHPDDVAFLIVVSSCGVSPAVQMRYGSAEQLRRNGYSQDDLRQLAELRIAVESYLRGDGDRATAQALVDDAKLKPWFPLIYLRDELPAPGAWEDMDFDPAAVFAGVSCPVLAFYGETDEWVPIEESVAAWQRTGNADLTIERLPGCDHEPVLNGQSDIEAISPEYTTIMTGWLDTRLSAR